MWRPPDWDSLRIAYNEVDKHSGYAPTYIQLVDAGATAMYTEIRKRLYSQPGGLAELLDVMHDMFFPEEDVRNE